MFSVAWYLLFAAFVLDYLLADPEFSLHPIRLMGRAAEKAEPVFRRLPVSLFWSGLLFAVGLILCAWAVAAMILSIAGELSPVLAGAVNILLIYFCLSARSLEKAALAIRQSLALNRPDEARSRLAMVVGRDVETLDPAGVSRAAVETVAENLVDGVISPLFFAVLGGAPLAVAFKMASTLDSMVGYKDDHYALFGKAAARIDDAANFIPARLSLLIIPVAASALFGSGKSAMSIAVREGRNHSSPNSGYPEAAFAGALFVRLGGPSYYQGCLVEKPYIGQKLGKTGPPHIEKACRLMMLSSVISLVISCLTVII